YPVLVLSGDVAPVVGEHVSRRNLEVPRSVEPSKTVPEGVVPVERDDSTIHRPRVMVDYGAPRRTSVALIVDRTRLLATRQGKIESSQLAVPPNLGVQQRGQA